MPSTARPPPGCFHPQLATCPRSTQLALPALEAWLVPQPLLQTRAFTRRTRPRLSMRTALLASSSLVSLGLILILYLYLYCRELEVTDPSLQSKELLEAQHRRLEGPSTRRVRSGSSSPRTVPLVERFRGVLVVQRIRAIRVVV